MIRTFHRYTTAADVTWVGRGLHSGEPVRATVHPGTQGIVFRSGAERIPARPESVTDTSRCTRLGSVSTVEHLLSAMAGLGITDADIEVEGGELPGLDGAAAVYFDDLQAAGLVELGTREIEGPFARVFWKDDPVSVAIAQGEGHWRYRFDAEGRWFGEQVIELELTPDRYRTEIAPARTFCFEEEFPHLEKLGLGRGLDETSAFVVGRDRYRGETRFSDEPVRHKMLDLIGDLALAGIPIDCLNVTGERSGHRAHVAAAARLVEAVRISGD
ncbi:MAG TPA: UDP-3-O-acyl-N-acetylglucosamine deacetylase [Fimbriimonadaceae bacterium]|nr:UDP-3-O-acyl-N-acetylglucosamine deacetylase [Fimbriimonadaceae bacterium]HRJ32995.1 UDP-3-O-acyl-N-acetylglucosamine deacetylase [Fimbriimonadaceae bacterium]